MRAKSLLLTSMVAVVLAGCDSGGVNLGVSTVDNSVGGSGGGGGTGVNPCASYTTPANEARQGAWDGANCTYSATFVGETNPLTQSITIPFISGVHIFQDSLFVGQNVDTGVAPAAGTGPTLTIAAGNKIAFTATDDYLRINRGSRIVAQGTAARPITFTGFTDAVTGTAGPEDVQLWGGIVINGNGITNNCTDAQRQANQCHVLSEGKPSHYGGSVNTESSGILRYVVVKHAGFAVAPDDELNGITFNAVGSGTVVENVEVYSGFDDGIEFFGGAVNVRNYVALYVRDDSIDYSDGWVGTVENALVIHSLTNGNWCIEADNINSTRGTGAGVLPVSDGTIRNMTCITSYQPQGAWGASRGAIIRQGAQVQIADSIFYAGYGKLAYPNAQTTPTAAQGGGAAVPGRVCFDLTGEPSTIPAVTGESSVAGSIVACELPALGNFAPLNTQPAMRAWLEGTGAPANVGNVVITDPLNAQARILEPASFYTATSLTDASGAAIAALPPGRSYGAVTRTADWTAGWTYGLNAANRGQPLWFE